MEKGFHSATNETFITFPYNNLFHNWPLTHSSHLSFLFSHKKET